MINNVQQGHALVKTSISPNGTHNDAYNTTEYDLHNVSVHGSYRSDDLRVQLFGHMILHATHNALLQVFPGRRPFVLGRSTFAGSGTIASHWRGDNNSKWGSMYLSISQALTFMIAGLPMVYKWRLCDALQG